jgi:hypothetical protein
MHRNHPQDSLCPSQKYFSLSTQQSPLNTHPIAEHPKAFGQTSPRAMKPGKCDGSAQRRTRT